MREKVSTFNSLEEEMEFWDTHDTTDFIDEEVTVEEIIRENTPASVTINLDIKLLSEINHLANRLNIDSCVLMHNLLFEGLKSFKKSTLEMID